jgi:hypothetical protein
VVRVVWTLIVEVAMPNKNLPPWLDTIVDELGWPDGQYPYVGMAALEEMSDNDDTACLLQMLINRIEQLEGTDG